MTRYNWIALVLLCSLGTAWAINIELGTKDLVQPDGTRFSVREYMDEYGHYLVAERGFVVQNATTGYYYYARYDRTGYATPSTLRVGRDDASSDVAQLAFENHQALSKMARRLRGGGAVGAAVTGSATSLPESLLVILVEFSDIKHQNNKDWPIVGLTGGDKDDGNDSTNDYPEYRVSQFEAMLFGDYTGTSPDGDTVYGSMRQYWEDMSREQYTLKGRVVNQVREDDTDIPIWVTLKRKKSYYHKGTHGEFKNAALAAARQQGINTTTSATRKICIIYAGNVYYDFGGLHPRYGANVYIMSERTAVSHGVERNEAEFAHIGIHCHEFGHVLGLYDHYGGNYDYQRWGLMAGGAHKELEEQARHLCHPILDHYWAGLRQPRSQALWSVRLYPTRPPKTMCTEFSHIPTRAISFSLKTGNETRAGITFSIVACLYGISKTLLRNLGTSSRTI